MAGPKVHALKLVFEPLLKKLRVHPPIVSQAIKCSRHFTFRHFRLKLFAIENGHRRNAISAGTCACQDSDLGFVARSNSIWVLLTHMCNDLWRFVYEWHSNLITVKNLARALGQSIRFQCVLQQIKILSYDLRIFAQALAYDRGSAWRSIISGCLLQKESHHPLVTSTWGSRVLAIC